MHQGDKFSHTCVWRELDGAPGSQRLEMTHLKRGSKWA